MRETPSLTWRDPARGLTLTAREVADDRLIAHIEAIPFGTKGLRYRYRGMASHLRAISHPLYLELEHDGALVGTYVLSKKRVHTPLGTLDAWYRGLLTVADGQQGQGYGRVLVEQAFAWFRARAGAEGRPLLTYGCIEGENARSQKLLGDLDARVIGTFSALPVYLHRPREETHIEPLNPGETPAIAEALRAQYAALGLSDVGARIDPARYFIVPGQGGPVAGASVHVERLILDDIGGALDPIVRTLVRVPGVRDRVDLDDLRWLKLHDLYVRPGFEDRWPGFVEALCARHGVNVAVFFLDPAGPTRAALAEGGVFDLVTRLFDTPISVSVAAFGDGTEAMLDAITDRGVCLYPGP
ncbi:MAG: GNAT family N-acetyltransferase [Myxococcales bacterium]|nr:GNAT family N-acetyltransferase [Myxococcales bacterium]